jgi:hypothetical protein
MRFYPYGPLDEPQASAIRLFLPSEGYYDWYWSASREGDDCRVIAAGLIAAMYETGEFDD